MKTRFGTKLAAAAVLLLAASPRLHAATIEVTSVLDDGSGCTLREAIGAIEGGADANGCVSTGDTYGTNDTITFVAGPLTITLGSALPDITKDLTITGNGAADTIVQASDCDPITLPGGCTPATYRVISVTNSGDLTLDNLTLRYGASSGGGGGILNNGTLGVSACRITNNLSSGFGGAIENNGVLTVDSGSSFLNNQAVDNIGGAITNFGTLTVADASFSANIAGAFGGGLYNASMATVSRSTFDQNSATSGGGIYNNSGTLYLIDSTVSANNATDGAGIYNAITGSVVTVTNSTLAHNAATGNGGGIFNQGDTVNLNNSIVADNSGGSQCADASGSNITNAQHSLIQDNLNCVNGTNTNNLSGDPNLGTLTGSPAYYPLNAGSIAINAGDNSLAVDQNGGTLATDEAGNARIYAGTVDMGAYELAYPPYLVVDTTSDADLESCTTAANDCSLRGAINLANAIGGTNTITFDSMVFNPGTITLTSALPQISNDLTITGNGAANTIIDGAGSYQVFYIALGVTAGFSDMTIQHGSNSSASGGGIENHGTLTVSNSSVSANIASVGGGIENLTTLTLTNSTVSGNAVSVNGGGIDNAGTLTVINSTLSDNSASSSGGGIENGGTLTVINSTISGNSDGGGISSDNGTFILNNSIIANSTGGDCYLGFGTIYASHSLIMDSANACGLSNGTNGNIVGSDPLLGPLANNGGPTQTMLPAAGSPAIDAGDNNLAAQPGSGEPLSYDQRGTGYNRISGSRVDMGAVEVRQAQLTLTVGPNGAVSTTSDATLTTANIDSCSNTTCTASYDIEGGAPMITATAAPATGYHFAGWTGDCPGGGANFGTTVTMDADKGCGATFLINTYTIGGTISGLSGTLVLQDNGTDDLTKTSDGSFTFNTALDYGADFAVTVKTQPSGQNCTVSNGTGTVDTADVTDVIVTCAATPANVALTNDDSLTYAQYGQVVDYTVTLSNTGGTAASPDVTLSSTLSAAFDTTNASSVQWTCIATNGAMCTNNGSGSSFSDTVNLPALSSVTYNVSVTLLANSNAATATFEVSASVAGSASDTDTLVIFRDGFEGSASAAAAQAKTISGADSQAVLQGNGSDFVTVPPITHNGVETLQTLSTPTGDIRVQRLSMNGESYVRLLAHANDQEERASAWSAATAGTMLGIGSVAGTDGQRIVLLSNTAQPLSLAWPSGQ